jgi:hypothetical protein
LASVKNRGFAALGEEFLRSVLWWESGCFDDGAIALVGVEEVVGGVVLDPEERRVVLTKACFKV